jgi:hypothetical protein
MFRRARVHETGITEPLIAAARRAPPPMRLDSVPAAARLKTEEKLERAVRSRLQQ